ncbi:hypothetical protein FBU59_005511 [Linderina macrospora]|uniref:Uncharacterized protein n=1 Tax=Linderina macrospora TaxID=4868 RepID=A0ACC1J2C8_9FUNG|nr:hypothetical protein FBU59_005511 [Linderina macrospora]
MLYEREHKVPLWTDANKKRMQRAIQQKFEENLAITQVRSNDRQTRFLLNRKCQLKSDRAYKRVVASRGTENQLYFYMATTVLWAANYSSSAIIYNLWVGILDDLPERVRSVGGSSTTGAHEPAFRTLWSNAIDWLVKLADYVTKHGPKHLINKAPQSGWDSGGVSGGPPLELIEGLARDDVCGLLKVLPILLDKQLPQNKKMDLSDELDRFFHG